MDDRKNSFALFQRERDLVHYVGGLDRCGRENYQQLRTRCQSVLDGAIPALTGLDIQSVHPYSGSACPQVFRKAQRELSVFMSVTEERKLSWFQ